jgi:hypothetical protein
VACDGQANESRAHRSQHLARSRIARSKTSSKLKKRPFGIKSKLTHTKTQDLVQAETETAVFQKRGYGREEVWAGAVLTLPWCWLLGSLKNGQAFRVISDSHDSTILVL